MYKLYIYGRIDQNHRLTVRDERGQIHYLIDGSSNKQLVTLSTITGENILSAKQIMFSPLPLFHIFANDRKIATVRKHPGLFGVRDPYFAVQPQSWTVTGDFINTNLTIHHKKKAIAKCKKIFIDEYELFQLDLKEETNAPLASLLVVLLDYYSHLRTENEDTQKNNNHNYGFGFFYYNPTLPTKITTKICKIKTR